MMKLLTLLANLILFSLAAGLLRGVDNEFSSLTPRAEEGQARASQAMVAQAEIDTEPFIAAQAEKMVIPTMNQVHTEDSSTPALAVKRRQKRSGRRVLSGKKDDSDGDSDSVSAGASIAPSRCQCESTQDPTTGSWSTNGCTCYPAGGTSLFQCPPGAQVGVQITSTERKFFYCE